MAAGCVPLMPGRPYPVDGAGQFRVDEFETALAFQYLAGGAWAGHFAVAVAIGHCLPLDVPKTSQIAAFQIVAPRLVVGCLSTNCARVACHSSSTRPTGPFRCLATMSSASDWSACGS